MRIFLFIGSDRSAQGGRGVLAELSSKFVQVEGPLRLFGLPERLMGHGGNLFPTLFDFSFLEAHVVLFRSFNNSGCSWMFPMISNSS